MKNEHEVSLARRGSINKAKTSIYVRLGTKHKLQGLAKKGESYDDVISRLIRSEEINRRKIEDYQMILRQENIDYQDRNIIQTTYTERGIDSIQLSNGAVIQFSYNKPSEYNELYTMDIELDEIVAKKPTKTETQELLEDPEQYTNVLLWIVGRIINRHFDSAYDIPGNKMIIDPVYWEQVKERVGLPETSFRRDIIETIMRYEEKLHE